LYLDLREAHNSSQQHPSAPLRPRRIPSVSVFAVVRDGGAGQMTVTLTGSTADLTSAKHIRPHNFVGSLDDRLESLVSYTGSQQHHSLIGSKHSRVAIRYYHRASPAVMMKTFGTIAVLRRSACDSGTADDFTTRFPLSVRSAPLGRLDCLPPNNPDNQRRPTGKSRSTTPIHPHQRSLLRRHTNKWHLPCK